MARPERIHAMQVTPSFFRLIRVAPGVGRGFTDEEGEIGKNLAVVLSHGLWKRLFGGQDAINHTVRIDGHSLAALCSAPRVPWLFAVPSNRNCSEYARQTRWCCLLQSQL